jgi:PAS domain S-box-containing protein
MGNLRSRQSGSGGHLMQFWEGADLDGGDVEFFDDIAKLLAQLCDVPIVVINLAGEDRSRVLAQIGLLEDQIDSGASLSSLTLGQRDLLEVTDTQKDDRFANHILIAGKPHLRFFAGLRLTLPGGQVLGGVAVMDKKPRSLSGEQRDAVERLTRQISRHLELRDAIRKREAMTERLDFVVEGICDGIWDLDLGARSVSISPKLFTLLGLESTAADLPTQAIPPIVHPEDRRDLVRALARQMSRELPFEHEFRCKHASKGWRWFRAHAITKNDRQGGSRRLVGSLTDIHEQRLASENLQRVSRLLAESQALGRVGGWELDMETQRLYWTAETHRIHQTSPRNFTPTIEAAIGFLVPGARQKMRDAVRDALACGSTFSMDVQLVTARSRRLWVRATGHVVTQENRPARVVGAFQDITAQRELEGELLSAKERAETANKAKSAFLATMSHEIRTPMHTILGYAEMLHDTSLGADQHECVSVISSSGNSLLKLIDDILDLSKIEAGKMCLDVAPFNLNEVVAQVAVMLRPQATKKGVELSAEVHDEQSSVILGDAQRVRQVLINLVSNAVKFTSEGRIEVTMSEQGDQMTVEVRDTGIGVPADRVADLFEDFVQVNDSDSQMFGGSGLGLSISKKLIEAMGGKIGFRSAHDDGSVFWFTMPIAASYARPVEVGELSTQSNDSLSVGGVQDRRALIVDDNQLNLLFAVRILESVGFVVDAVDCGSKAVQSAANVCYDVILMDCQMPVMDGLEATKAIRQREDGGARVPIIALTANAQPEARAACQAVGMNGFISKPFTKDSLCQAVASCLELVVN